jgi:hypothetical protein
MGMVRGGLFQDEIMHFYPSARQDHALSGRFSLGGRVMRRERATRLARHVIISAGVSGAIERLDFEHHLALGMPK